MRVSSNDHDPVELLEFMSQIVGLALPVRAYIVPPARPIGACPNALRTGTAHLIEPSLDLIVTSSLLVDGIGTARDSDDETTLLPESGWCRDTEFTDQLVYRADGSPNAYAVMLNDAGDALPIGYGRTCSRR